jgi:hypothetical protein
MNLASLSTGMIQESALEDFRKSEPQNIGLAVEDRTASIIASIEGDRNDARVLSGSGQADSSETQMVQVELFS